MHRELDFVIPEELIDLIDEDRFDLQIKLSGFKFKNKLPRVKIMLNDQILASESVTECYEFKYSTKIIPKEKYCLSLEFYNKLDNDTLTDENGNIIENLGFQIKSIIINDIDLVATKIIFNLGEYTPKLSDNKLKWFIENNIPHGPNKTLGIFENGIWKINMVAPMLSHFVQFQAFIEKHELWPNLPLLNEIYNTINNIKLLEQQLNKNKE